MTSECEDCKGTGFYVGLIDREPCKSCAGVPEEIVDERTTEPIDTTAVIGVDGPYTVYMSQREYNDLAMGLAAWMLYKPPVAPTLDDVDEFFRQLPCSQNCTCAMWPKDESNG